MGAERCLLCYKECPLKGQGDDFKALISRELYAIFILRNIFELPVLTLENYLKELGTNPSKWISVCEECGHFVEKARRVYTEILEAQRRFRKVKGDIIQYLRRNKRRGDGAGIKAYSLRKGLRVTEETRRFVNDHNYSDSLVDPFVGGDNQAQKVLYSSNVVGGDLGEENDTWQEELVNMNVKIEPDDTDFVVDELDDIIVQETLDYFDDQEDQEEDDFENEADNDEDYSASSSVKSHQEKALAERQGGNDVIHRNEGPNDEGFYRCACGKNFNQKRMLCRHVREATMDISEQVKCPVATCNVRFKRLWDLKIHLSKVHPDVEWQPPKSLRDLEPQERKPVVVVSQVEHQHVESRLNEDGDLEWVCSCENVYANQEKLRRHIKEATMDPSEMQHCPVCDRRFRRRWDLKRHISRHHKNEDSVEILNKLPPPKRIRKAYVSTSKEPYSNEDTNELPAKEIEHEKMEGTCEMEDGTKFWKCRCLKIYLTEAALEQHVDEETISGSNDAVDREVSSKNKCDVCDMEFKRRIERNVHLRKVHGVNASSTTTSESRTPVENEDTGASRDSRGSDEEDANVLADVNVNEKEFHEKLGLCVNEDGSESWNCSCGKRFRSQKTMHRHTKERSMKEDSMKPCPQCDRKFKRHNELKRHTESVHGLERYPCDKCDRLFTLKDKLRLHQRAGCVAYSNEGNDDAGDTEQDQDDSNYAIDM